MMCLSAARKYFGSLIYAWIFFATPAAGPTVPIYVTIRAGTIVQVTGIAGNKVGRFSPAEKGVYIYVTNRAATTVQVIDAATNKVVQTIGGIEVPQSVHFSPDGSRVYVDDGSQNILHVLDRKTGRTIGDLPLEIGTGYADDLAVTKDGKYVLLCVRSTPGVLDIIDLTTLRLVKSIQFNSGLHDIIVTDDGKFALVGSPEGHFLAAIDIQLMKTAWEINFDQGVMPFTVEDGANGTPWRVFVNLEVLNGFAVVDFAKHAELARVTLPSQPTDFAGWEGSPSHGVLVSPDGKTLWVTSKPANSVFVYALPDLKLLGQVAMPEEKLPGLAPIGAQPDWITFTPDSARAYISNGKLKSISVIDVESLKLIAVVPVGEVPAKISTLAVP
jgi:YVTN family beta-propeller protein